MEETKQFLATYLFLVVTVLLEIFLAVNWRTLGFLSTLGILGILGVQMIFVYLYYMHGKYANKAITYLMILSVLVIVPLFAAFYFSIETPRPISPFTLEVILNV